MQSKENRTEEESSCFKFVILYKVDNKKPGRIFPRFTKCRPTVRISKLRNSQASKNTGVDTVQDVQRNRKESYTVKGQQPFQPQFRKK